jgi:Rrf2 family protein
MKLSTRSRYALRLAAELASGGDTPTPCAELARDQDISPGYAEQILMRLKTAGIVRSRRGGHGGFLLAQPPADVTAAEIIEATEGPIELVDCGPDGSRCNRAPYCNTRAIWAEASRRLQAYFASVSLADIVKGDINRSRGRGKTPKRRGKE